MKKLFFVLLFTLLMTGCTQQVSVPPLTQEQQDILAGMPLEERYYVKECYQRGWSFSHCLSQKQEVYHPVPTQKAEGGSVVVPLVTGAAAGYLLGRKK